MEELTAKEKSLIAEALLAYMRDLNETASRTMPEDAKQIITSEIGECRVLLDKLTIL